MAMESLEAVLRKRIKDKSSAPALREDRAQVALAIEGGGMTGAVSGGMCLFLEEAGYTRVFDRIYGCSSGALNGSYTSLGQAKQGIENYLDMSARLLRPSRIFKGRSPLALDDLFVDIINNKRPLLFERHKNSPSFSALVLSQKDYKLRVKNDFRSASEMALLVRASCTMPLLGGGPVAYRDDLLFDGGLVESIPAFSAITDGATHVLVFRSQSASYRKDKYPEAFDKIMKLYDKNIAELLLKRPGAYNQEAGCLDRQETPIRARCRQVAIKEDVSRGHLSLNPSRQEVESWVTKGYQACSYFFRELAK